ncbi:MAG: ankyrin repeat domain-containing protein [Deltaproteobacteria bacterium]|nr:ankyrin repeat domain-containing protein [Deltaproteobacteria bacterium]
MPQHRRWTQAAVLGVALTLAVGCAGTVTLHQAAERGDSALLEALLVQGTSPDAVDSRGRTPLHRAARRGQLGAARQLIEHGARIDARTNKSQTPLFLAVEKRRVAVVKLLLEHRANPDLADADRRTPLMQAARDGEIEIAKMLLVAGADPSLRDEDRDSALMLAADKRNIQIVRLLLTHKADPNTPDRDQRTPLYHAVEQRDQEIVEQLLEAGADPNLTTRDGSAPLVRAVEHGDGEITQLLLEHNADANATSSSRDPVLVIAVRRQDAESSEMLLEAGADPDTRGSDGRPPLVAAVQNRDAMVVELLMHGGADPRIWDSAGYTPLYYSVNNRDHETAQVLLENGAPPDLPNKNGARPIVVAVTNQDRGMVSMLIAAGATPVKASDAFLDPAGFIEKYGVGQIIKASIANASEEARKAKGPHDEPSTPPATPERPSLEDAAKRMPTGVDDPWADTETESSADQHPTKRRPGPTPSARKYYSRRVAVVVGIDDYARWPGLEGAGRDARRVSESLRARGFDEVIEIYDRDATRRRILSVLGNELAQKTDENSMAVIYFAGHGETETLPTGEKRGYIVPADGDPEQVFATAISMDTLRSISSRLPAKQVYYAMDSCYSGLGLTRGLSIPRVANENYIEKITSLRAVQMITAGAEGEQALERGGQGLFTRYFLRAIEGEADLDGDGWVTASEIGTYVRPHVTNASSSRQTPRFGTLEGTGEVVFAAGTP